MSFSFVYESWYRCLTCAGVCGITVSRINMKRFGTDSLKFPVHPKVSLNGSVNIQKLMNTYQMSSLPWRWFRQRQFERARACATDVGVSACANDTFRQHGQPDTMPEYSSLIPCKPDR